MTTHSSPIKPIIMFGMPAGRRVVRNCPVRHWLVSDARLKTALYSGVSGACCPSPQFGLVVDGWVPSPRTEALPREWIFRIIGGAGDVGRHQRGGQSNAAAMVALRSSMMTSLHSGTP